MYRCRQVVSQCRSTLKPNFGQGKPGGDSTKRFASDHGYSKSPITKPASFGEMPTPHGSWAQANARRQAKYNMHLLGGIGFLGFSLFVGYQTGAFYLNYEPDYSKIPIKVLTHEEAKRNMEKAAKEEPAPEPEDVAPATFEAEPEATSNIAAADIEVAENEQPTEGDDLPPAVSDIVEQTTVVDDLPTAVSEVVKSEADQEIVEPEQKSES